MGVSESGGVEGTPERIAEIRRRLTQIGAFPWRIEHGTANGWDVFAASGGSVCIEAWHGALEHERYKVRFKAEGDLVANAPADLAFLLAQVDASAARIAQLESDKTWLRAQRDVAEEKLKAVEGLLKAKYLNAACAADGCQWLKAEAQVEALTEHVIALHAELTEATERFKCLLVRGDLDVPDAAVTKKRVKAWQRVLDEALALASPPRAAGDSE